MAVALVDLGFVGYLIAAAVEGGCKGFVNLHDSVAVGGFKLPYVDGDLAAEYGHAAGAPLFVLGIINAAVLILKGGEYIRIYVVFRKGRIVGRKIGHFKDPHTFGKGNFKVAFGILIPGHPAGRKAKQHHRRRQQT